MQRRLCVFDFFANKKVAKLEAEVSELKFKLQMEQKEKLMFHDAVYEHKKEINGHIDDWNNLVRELKRMGGLPEIRERWKAKGGSSSFTNEELRVLIQLAHPDKHGGKEVYNSILQKLNKMKG